MLRIVFKEFYDRCPTSAYVLVESIFTGMDPRRDGCWTTPGAHDAGNRRNAGAARSRWYFFAYYTRFAGDDVPASSESSLR